MLNLLKTHLKEKYKSHYILCNKFEDINELKNRIKTLEDEMCEGIKIRARIDERLNGEKISNYLLGKEKNVRSNISKLINEDGICVTDSKAIEYCLVKYYKYLYKKQECDSDMQDKFLDLLTGTVGINENEMLMAEVTETELYKVIMSMKNGKTPGLDGLPIEFYKSMWHIIRKELLQVVRCIFSNIMMGKDMNIGVIKLVPKSNTSSNIENLRPITMLNVDYKIVTKLIANRLKQLLPLFISPEQFCGVPGRSITNCNTIVRDVIYYANNEEMSVALINLDWSKAFDRVSLDFLFKVLEKLGFSNDFIDIIKMLYMDARSLLCINGKLSESFPIMRSVRQGCPLSMILFIIAQEPLYRMMKYCIRNFSLTLPNNLKVCVLGYADDSSVVVTADQGIRDSFNVIKIYEMATGARLNYEKTCIFGMGKWRNRMTWPVKNVKVQLNNCKILGRVKENLRIQTFALSLWDGK